MSSVYGIDVYRPRIQHERKPLSKELGEQLEWTTLKIQYGRRRECNRLFRQQIHERRKHRKNRPNEPVTGLLFFTNLKKIKGSGLVERERARENVRTIATHVINMRK